MLRKINQWRLGLLKKMKFLPQDIYVSYLYRYYTGKRLDLNDPRDFNEKIQWYKVYFKPKILNQLVDKYEVRKYVAEKIGAQYLNECIGLYHSAADVDFDTLPNQFVIKGVHGCNFNLIVRDKKKLNVVKSKLLFRKWLLKNQYYRSGLEWAYKDVEPKLIAEKFLHEEGKNDITDYKFYCFNGKPKFLQIDIDRGAEHFKCYYDMEWERLPFTKIDCSILDNELKKPVNFDEMKDLAIKLACNFPFVRVDLYSIGGKTIFGEMTFYPSGGQIDFYPEKYNRIIGDYFQLPEIPKGQKEITSFIC